MAIDGFKEIVERRGYKVNSEDRKIFEKEIGKSYFGLGNADMIEFVLFDANDNKLPQGEDGKFVRYIHLNDSNIKDYFLISNNTFTKKINGASEFIVDIERLVREAGYSNGIFKTQVTLLNRRAGSEEGDVDKLWIHEISPSRTEIRILPLKNKNNPNLELEKRYQTFVDKKQFRDDTIYYAKRYIENITTERVLDSFSTIKGTQSDGETYRNLIKKEFKIDSIENFVRKVRDKFIQSMDYFISGREWNLNNINYGKPKEELDTIELTIETINRICEQSLTIILQNYLPKRTIQEENELTPEQQITFDEVKQILKSSVSDTEYDSTVPDKIDALIRGCKDPDALNYNPQAQEDDGSCRYRIVIDPIEVGGCTDAIALNYNPQATFDDGSCKCKTRILKKTETYYVWSDRGGIKYKQDGQIKTIEGIEYDSFKITYDDDNTIKFTGDVRLVPKVKQPEPVMRSYQIKNATEKFLKGNELTFAYKDALGNVVQGTAIRPGSSTTVCAQKGSIVLPPNMKARELGECGIVPPPDPILGCTDPKAINYKASANQDDGSCKYTVRGCTDPKALNYDATANTNDGSCKYDVRGCTDPKALNYDRTATKDDGSCKYPQIKVRGCTDSRAINYNADANIDDGSCRYTKPGGGTGGSGGGGSLGGGTSDGRLDDGSFVDDRSDRLDRNMQ